MGTICVQGRLLAEADLDYIRQLLVEHPEWLRQRLSIHLAEQWQWRNAAGQLKDMAARTLLLKLHRRGLINLPPSRIRAIIRRRRASAPTGDELDLFNRTADPIEGPLGRLQPLIWDRVQSLAQRRRVTELLQRYHYQGYSGAVGENIQYLVRDASGRELALMVFGAAAWKVAPRDDFVGWSVAQRQAGLSGVVNQQRFLILPWVRVHHLASHLLGRAVQCLSSDWQQRYGHRVWLVESFVQDNRFQGTAYKAAGWIRVGQTTGRTRQDRDRLLQTPIKSIWLKPLHPQFRKHLKTAL